jgi:hypothetical protein
MKFGYTLLEKPNISKLKPTEMNLLFYLVAKQDNTTGKVYGVHHKDVSNSTGMVKQSFYSAMKALKDKEIITYKRHNAGAYYTVTVLDNAFPDRQSMSKGFINLQQKVFYSQEFQKLKAHEKYLVLYFCKRTHENRGSFHTYTYNLYNKLSKLLGVTERVIRSYLHSLKHFFAIGIKNGQYYITYLHNKFKNKIDKPERLVRDEGYIREVVHKLKIRNTNNDEITQTAELIHQYKQTAQIHHKDIKKSILEVISNIVADKLQKDRNLPFKLINKLLNQKLTDASESQCYINGTDISVKDYEYQSIQKIKTILHKNENLEY